MWPMISEILSMVSLIGRRSGNFGSSHLQHTMPLQLLVSCLQLKLMDCDDGMHSYFAAKLKNALNIGPQGLLW